MKLAQEASKKIDRKFSAPGRVTGALLLTNDQGAIILEWGLVALGLVLGLFMFIDCANMVNQYMELSQAAFEGVITAGNYPALETVTATDLTPTTQEQSDCANTTQSPSFPCGHYVVQQRAKFAAQQIFSHTSWNPSISNLSVTTQFIPPSGGATSSENTVVVTMSVRFWGLILLGIPIQATVKGQYLYQL